MNDGIVHIKGKHLSHPSNAILYDELIFAVGKSGIDFGKQLADDYSYQQNQNQFKLEFVLKHHKNTSKN
jgi:uncharacterized FAD-dependent dehydrogenase